MNTMRHWRDRAACRTEDPELFFPVGDCGPALVQIAAAKAVCARCPVVAHCLGFALAALPEGIAAGLTAQERQALRAQRQRRSCSPAASTARLPAGGGVLVVAQLVAGERVSCASRQELAQAAVELHQVGRGCRWIASWLGVADRQVYRWLERHRVGEPLAPATAKRRGRTVVGVGRG